jgi:hypothetical protein
MFESSRGHRNTEASSGELDLQDQTPAAGHAVTPER